MVTTSKLILELTKEPLLGLIGRLIYHESSKVLLNLSNVSSKEIEQETRTTKLESNIIRIKAKLARLEKKPKQSKAFIKSLLEELSELGDINPIKLQGDSVHFSNLTKQDMRDILKHGVKKAHNEQVPLGKPVIFSDFVQSQYQQSMSPSQGVSVGLSSPLEKDESCQHNSFSSRRG